MKLKNILVPIDFSESAVCALRYAREMADECGAVLHVFYVAEFPLRNGADKPAMERCHGTELSGLDRLRGFLGPIDETRIKPLCSVGTPLTEIIEYATVHSIDLIVMATHLRLPSSQMAAPSVTDSIVRQAPCPVLVVPAPVRELVA